MMSLMRRTICSAMFTGLVLQCLFESNAHAAIIRIDQVSGSPLEMSFGGGSYLERYVDGSLISGLSFLGRFYPESGEVIPLAATGIPPGLGPHAELVVERSGAVAITDAWGNSIHRVDGMSGASLNVLTGIGDWAAFSIELDANDDYFVTADLGRLLRVDSATGDVLQERMMSYLGMQLGSLGSNLATSASGELFLASGLNIYLVDPITLMISGQVASVPGGVVDMEIDSSGRIVLASPYDVRRLDPVTGQQTILFNEASCPITICTDINGLFRPLALAVGPQDEIYLAAIVPEPNTALLVMAGLVGMAGLRRR